MATLVPGDRQTVNFSPSRLGPLNPPVPNDAVAHGIVGTIDEGAAYASQLAFLLEINTALAAAPDVEPVLGSVLARLAERERLSLVRIFQLSEAADEFRELSGDSRHLGSAVPLEELPLLTWVLQQKQEVYIPRVDLDPRCQEWDSKRVKSAYLVPLRAGARLVGVLEVGVVSSDGIRSATRNLVDQVARQAAQALERDELFRQIRASVERFRSIFEHVPFGIVLAKTDGTLSQVNPAFARLLASTCEELEGKHFSEITSSGDAAAIEEWIRELREGKSNRISCERRFLRKSGEPLWCAASVSLLRLGPRISPCFLAIVQDITARKCAEEEQRRLQQQLFQAQKMEAIGTLAGGIAHDFNNLLSVMLGFASLARQRLPATHPLQDSMGMIEESAQRAAELTRQLLAFARPEKQPVKPVCVQEVLQRIRRMVERTFDRSIKVEVEAPEEPLWVNAEPSYLEQSLLNLCLNARDAMPRGGRLAIALTTPHSGGSAQPTSGESRAREMIGISVQDSGTGIPPGDLQRIFDPFYSTKEPGHGTGLGLAMVYGFVKNHDGQVEVESELGKGSRFTVLLPKVPVPDRAETRPTATCEPGRGTVLVVDDEPLVRAFTSEGLRRLGYRVVLAEGGREALKVYQDHPESIDCVLLDLVMPELSGIEVFRRLRTLNPKVCVLFASGYSTGEILRGAPDAQQAMFIGKPYTLESLAGAIRQAIGNREVKGRGQGLGAANPLATGGRRKRRA